MARSIYCGRNNQLKQSSFEWKTSKTTCCFTDQPQNRDAFQAAIQNLTQVVPSFLDMGTNWAQKSIMGSHVTLSPARSTLTEALGDSTPSPKTHRLHAAAGKLKTPTVVAVHGRWAHVALVRHQGFDQTLLAKTSRCIRQVAYLNCKRNSARQPDLNKLQPFRLVAGGKSSKQHALYTHGVFHV